jgi:hypothetical protein
MGLTKSALKYGGTPSGKYDTGHAFAKFPTKEAGAAAQFSMWWNGPYRNHTLQDAIHNPNTGWVGKRETGEADDIAKRLGIPLNTKITDEFLRGPMGIKLMQAQAHFEGANVLTKEQWGRAQDWAYKGINPRIKGKSSTEDSTPASTTTEKGATPVIHYSPNITIHAPGVYDAKGLSEHIKSGLAEHSDHLVRVLQDSYRDHQRVNYA